MCVAGPSLKRRNRGSGGGVWDAWALRRTIMLQAILFCPLVSTQLPHGQAYALKESADIKSKAQLINKTCGPGRAGDSCQFSLSTVYRKHNPYDGFVPPPKDKQPGWPGLQPLSYQTLVLQLEASLIIEVGVWKGDSAIPMAQGLREAGRGCLFAVDTWLGALEFWTLRSTQGQYDPRRDMHFEHGYPRVFFQFLGNVVRQNVSEYVVPFPVPSRLAADFFALHSVEADIVHIDAGHEYNDVCDDLELWWPRVKSCGLLIGDDYHATCRMTQGWHSRQCPSPGVARAVEKFSADRNLTVQFLDPERTGRP
eukprot:765466-Prymnesium_polylepis.1